MYIKSQKTQSNPEEKEQSWRHNPPRLQTRLQSYNNQNTVVLAEKTDIWVNGQDRGPKTPMIN